MGDVRNSQVDFEAFDDGAQGVSNPRVVKPLAEVIRHRLSRRDALKAMVVAAAGSAAGIQWNSEEAAARALLGGASTLTFKEVPHGLDENSHLAPGYDMQVLFRWGDRVVAGAPDFDPANQSAKTQDMQFGYNCDFISFLSLPPGSHHSDHGLLCVNHEYTDTNLMFPNVEDFDSLLNLTPEQVNIELAAHGHSVIEIKRVNGLWEPVEDSKLNRRISAFSTEMLVSGPAAGHARLQTSDDPSGKRVIGTLNNCAGGFTPWGTMLLCEENFDGYFTGDGTGTPEAANHQRYGLKPKSKFRPAWAKHFSRFDVAKEPNEPNRFGWVVEFDPYDPNSVPVKRTALGRMKHEGAGLAINHDGRIVIYCGDDEAMDYVYKFVTEGVYRADDPETGKDLLDSGTLYVARFDDSQVEWLPLVFGQGPLTAENGFHSQADVVIETRRASDLLGATPMDRPEDVEVCPTTGRVYVLLTGGVQRGQKHVCASNPLADNKHGHVLELTPPSLAGGADHAAASFAWDFFLRCGDPTKPEDKAAYPLGVSESGWLTRPDNALFDNRGRMWISTDGAEATTGFADSVYACDTTGPGRGITRQFFAAPRGAEVTGICFTPDDETMFISVQHPAEEKGSDYLHPSTRWPDFNPALPPRPAVVAIHRQGGGRIGS